MVDLCPEEHQQGVSAEEEQAREVQQYLLHDWWIQGLDLYQSKQMLILLTFSEIGCKGQAAR